MAGAPGRSGRKRITAPKAKKAERDAALEALKTSMRALGKAQATARVNPDRSDEVQARAGEVLNGIGYCVVIGALDPRVAEPVIAAAKAQQSGAGTRAKLNDIPHLEKLLVETKKVVMAGLQQAAGGRQAAPVVHDPEASAPNGTTKN